MDIILHFPGAGSDLGEHYRRAFAEAVELYVVTAYLTEWNSALTLSPDLRRFRFIIGKDFGITRKDACRSVMRWLPARLKSDFYVADRIQGFHPKAVFWRCGKDRTHMLMGSSNLSKAAFQTNVEANVYSAIDGDEFRKASSWIDWLTSNALPMSDQWLEQYKEAVQLPARRHSGQLLDPTSPVISFQLPNPRNPRARLAERRKQLDAHQQYRGELLRMFRRCASGEIDSRTFYQELPRYWGHDRGNRIQGAGWHLHGKGADFSELSKSFVAILDADERDRDDMVRLHLDRLEETRNSARKAFFTEMLSLEFPDAYHVHNNPVDKFLSANSIKTQRGASAGARYIDVAKKLRQALKSKPSYPARNLVELDHLIWAEYGDE